MLGNNCYLLPFLVWTTLRSIYVDVQVSAERNVTSSEALRPVYQLHYYLFYNTSLPLLVSTVIPDNVPRKISNTCAEFYARTFLSNLISVEKWLNNQCIEEWNKQSQIQSILRVIIHPVAVVTVYGLRVKVETDINITLIGHHDADLSLQAVNVCAAKINSTVMHVSNIDAALNRQVEATYETGNMSRDVTSRRQISVINETLDCQLAELSPTGLQYRAAEWHCTDSLLLIEPRLQCVHEEDDLLKVSTVATVATMTTARPQPLTSSTIDTLLTGNTDVTDSVQVPSTFTSTAAADAASLPPSQTSKLWGLQTPLAANRIYVTEGDRPYNLRLQMWFNRSALCHSPHNCTVAVQFAFSNNTDTAPHCRQSQSAIPQLVLSHTSWSKSGENVCSVMLKTMADETQRRHHVNVSDSDMSVASGNVFIKAVMDNKYDGVEVRDLIVSMSRKQLINGTEETLQETMLRIPVVVNDGDRKSTCQSVNDPHITTFDGFEYNNFYEGEFVLYRHKTLPFSVHAVYQKCSGDIVASCNCAVAVQSGDDVLVIDRCLRYRYKLPPPIGGYSDDHSPIMSVVLYLNGNLTSGTRIYQDAEGRIYLVYLPNGAYVKVVVSGQLINVWIVPSPSDLYMTQGLCGVYDGIKNNDIQLRNGSIVHSPILNEAYRLHPIEFILDWRIDINSKESLLRGVDADIEPYEPLTYCLCEQTITHCAPSLDVNYCDVLQGKDITESLIARAKTLVRAQRTKRLDNSWQHRLNSWQHRLRRGLNDNSVLTPFDDVSVINIDNKSVPPSKFKWKNGWNEVKADKFCREYIKDDYRIGQLCQHLSAVNFAQEITTCIEDIKITGNSLWAESARDAMKEQCREQVLKNTSLPQHIVDNIVSQLCINDCSHQGRCFNGSCECNAGHVSADCSILEASAPDTSAAWRYGLCDIRTMNCSHVIVYGNNFINSHNLTCHLQEAQVTSMTFIPLETTVTRKAEFISFNAVECSLPVIRSYLISISNNGINQSKALLFIPFDSACRSCNIFNTSCVKIPNSCIIDGICYREGDSSPSDHCLICKAFDDEFEWTTASADQCPGASWHDSIHLPDWLVAVAAAVVGSLVGVVIGFVLYKCCCHSKKLECDDIDDDDSNEFDSTRQVTPTQSAFDDSLLHRNHRTGLQSEFTAISDLLDNEAMTPATHINRLTNNWTDTLITDNRLDSTTYF